MNLPNALRELADFYEAHPNFPPIDVYCLNTFVNTAEELAAAAKDCDGCDKGTAVEWFYVYKLFPSGARIYVNIERDKVCERIVTTKRVRKHIPTAYEEREVDEEEVTWSCPESILDTH